MAGLKPREGKNTDMGTVLLSDEIRQKNRPHVCACLPFTEGIECVKIEKILGKGLIKVVL